MARDALAVGELGKRSGVSRKALRVYEAARILSPASRTRAGYRLYDADAVATVRFVKQAQRLGFRLGEIRDIVAIRRAGQAPCAHVRRLVRRKLADLEIARRALRALLRQPARADTGCAAVCPHIERAGGARSGRKGHGSPQGFVVPVVRRVPRGRDRRS
jgi:DNA-binding transcriptional MerR regulator